MSEHRTYPAHYHAYEILAIKQGEVQYEESISFWSLLKLTGSQKTFDKINGLKGRARISIVVRTILKAGILLKAKQVIISIQPSHNIESMGNEIQAHFLDKKVKILNGVILGFFGRTSPCLSI